MDYLIENIKEVKIDIEEASKKIDKKSDEIILIGVSKTIDVPKIEKAIEYGITDIGENKVQELVYKMDKLGEQVKYHMIGHLQTNKVKDLIGRVELIHSLDRMSLAKEINKRSKSADLVTNVLVQVNVSGEESKFGLDPKDVKEFIKDVSKLENVRIKGLMTMAPHVEDETILRKTFSDLRKLSEEIALEDHENVSMEYLSMGMTNDYKIAIEEGANIVRIGRKIFGERIY